MRLLVRVIIVWNFLRLVFRHHTDRTNATFFRPATRQRNAIDQRPVRWHWLPGYQRLLWKVAMVFGPGIIAWWWFHLTHGAVVVLVALLVFAVATATIVTLERRWKERAHNNDVVDPLQEAVTSILKAAA